MIEDTMENEWGVAFISFTEKRCGRRTFNNFGLDISREVPGYQLHSLQMCGTDANAEAIRLATDHDSSKCLFCVGAYVGGDTASLDFSTTGYTANGLLSMIKPYDSCGPKAKRQTVPLPYHVPSEWLDPDLLRRHEEECLEHLHRRLLLAMLVGQPYRALVLEYMLGGNGGILSVDFLKRLARVLEKFQVVIVADEILTGARVGPSIAMTTTLPDCIQERVEFITLGKFISCGVVLRRTPKKPVDIGARIRGFSTQADCGLASRLFDEVVKRLESGLLQERRKEVLKVMKCLHPDTYEDSWGKGLQIYTAFGRGAVMKGLKCRLLPRLEKSKLRRLDPKRSIWNRSTVCKGLVETTSEWIQRQYVDNLQGEHCYNSILVNYVTSRQISEQDEYLAFRYEELIDFVGKKKLECITKGYKQQQLEETGRKITASPEVLLKRAICSSISNTKESRAIYRKRIGHKRIEYNLVEARLLFR